MYFYIYAHRQTDTIIKILHFPTGGGGMIFKTQIYHSTSIATVMDISNFTSIIIAIITIRSPASTYSRYATVSDVFPHFS